MRIPFLAATWLAASGTALAETNQYVTFASTDFNGDVAEATGAAIFSTGAPRYTNSYQKTITWTAQYPVKSIALVELTTSNSLYTWELATYESGNTVASLTSTTTTSTSSSSSPGIMTPPKTEATTTSTSTPTSSSTQCVGNPFGCQTLAGGDRLSQGRRDNVQPATKTRTTPQSGATTGVAILFLDRLVRDQPSIKQPLFLQAYWTDNANNNGNSYSRNFTIVNNTVGVDLPGLEAIFSNPDPAFKEDLAQDPRSSSATDSGASSTASGAVVAASGSTNPDGSSSSSKSGLSNGAVAGIAVGAGVLVLALFCGILWCWFRRRNAKRAGLGGGFGSGERNRTQELMAAKEAGGMSGLGGGSPRAMALYSDEALNETDGDVSPSGPLVLTQRTSSLPPDGRRAQPGGAGTPGGGTADGERERSFTPYSDRPGSGGGGSVGGRMGSPLRGGESPATSSAPLAERVATPTRAISSPMPGRGTAASNYQHLVEEGMTEADILRLEEEERELDAAIERRGR